MLHPLILLPKTNNTIGEHDTKKESRKITEGKQKKNEKGMA